MDERSDCDSFPASQVRQCSSKRVPVDAVAETWFPVVSVCEVSTYARRGGRGSYMEFVSSSVYQVFAQLQCGGIRLVTRVSCGDSESLCIDMALRLVCSVRLTRAREGPVAADWDFCLLSLSFLGLTGPMRRIWSQRALEATMSMKVVYISKCSRVCQG